MVTTALPHAPTEWLGDEPVPPRGEWWSDEPPMETYAHLMQMLALIATLRWRWRDRDDYFAAGNLTVYFSPRQRKSEHFRGLDFFVVNGVDGARPRRSWVVWEEDGRYPDLIVELLSDTTEHVDRGEKMRIYEQTFRTPEYFLFDPRDGSLAGHVLNDGRYQPIHPDDNGLMPAKQLGLCFGVRGGRLRLFEPSGTVVPEPEEALRAAEQQADADRRRADDEQRRADDEQRRADDEQRRADHEQRRADAAEAELARLRSERR